MKKNLQSRLAIAIGVLGLMPMCTLMTESGKSYAKWQEGNTLTPLVEPRDNHDNLALKEKRNILHHRSNHLEMY